MDILIAFGGISGHRHQHRPSCSRTMNQDRVPLGSTDPGTNLSTGVYPGHSHQLGPSISPAHGHQHDLRWWPRPSTLERPSVVTFAKDLNMDLGYCGTTDIHMNFWLHHGLGKHIMSTKVTFRVKHRPNRSLEENQTRKWSFYLGHPIFSQAGWSCDWTIRCDGFWVKVQAPDCCIPCWLYLTRMWFLSTAAFSRNDPLFLPQVPPNSLHHAIPISFFYFFYLSS